jgi:hypothetical protein
VSRPLPSERRRRPSRAPRVLAVAAAIVVAFAVGLALGRALEEAPQPGGTQTLVRTLQPAPLPPAGRETVTVTVERG